MKREVAYAAWFHSVDCIGDRTLYALGDYFGSFEEAYKSKESLLRCVLNEKQFLHYPFQEILFLYQFDKYDCS